MRPYNHISDISVMLQRFATYLSCSAILKYRILAYDYDVPNGCIIVGDIRFTPKGNNLQGYNIKTGKVQEFTHFPTRDEILTLDGKYFS